MIPVVRELPLPPHFDPGRVGAVWRVPYEDRAREAEAWAEIHAVGVAVDDLFRVCLLAVDVQNTFCIPDFELFVAGRSGTGAVDDSRRLCEFVYRNLATITQIVPSLDTHHAMQVFHAIWLVDEHGRHPSPYTLVSLRDVEAERWRVNPAVVESKRAVTRRTTPDSFSRRTRLSVAAGERPTSRASSTFGRSASSCSSVSRRTSIRSSEVAI